MCTCDFSQTTDDYYSAASTLEPSIGQDSEWHTPVDRGVQSYDDSEYCSVECPASFQETPRTPRQGSYRVATPAAPLRKLARRPDLAHGVAIVRRRLDYDDTNGFEEEEDDLDYSRFARGLGDRRYPASSGYVPDESSIRMPRRPRRPVQPPAAPSAAQSRRYASKMTKHTPCGKCLRM